MTLPEMYYYDPRKSEKEARIEKYEREIEALEHQIRELRRLIASERGETQCHR